MVIFIDYGLVVFQIKAVKERHRSKLKVYLDHGYVENPN